MQPLTVLVAKFITARIADGRAPNTIKDYRRVLDPFAQRFPLDPLKGDEGGCQAAPLTRDTIRDYAAHLRTLGWGDGTVAIHIRNLRAFLRWLHDEGYTPDNLASAIKAPRQVIRHEIPITPDEVRRLLATCDPATFHGRRDRALILLLCDTGLRSGEIVRLRLGDWRREPESAGRITGSYLLIYAPKTRTYRYAILGQAATAALESYLDPRGNLPGDAPLFSIAPLKGVANGQAMKTRAIGSLLVRRSVTAGLERCRTHPHIFRKAFVTSSLDNGMDAERVRVLAGWTTMAMFKVYADSSLSRLQEAHRRAGPVDRMAEKWKSDGSV